MLELFQSESALSEWERILGRLQTPRFGDLAGRSGAETSVMDSSHGLAAIPTIDRLPLGLRLPMRCAAGIGPQ